MTSTVERKEESTLVGFGQFAQFKTSERLDHAFPSVRIAPLFYEFLSRYNDWKHVKLQVMIGTIIVLFLGLFAFIMPWLLPKVGIWVSLIIFILFFFALRYYLVVNERASHLYINVYVLHHHLIGKLEVGFCDHHEPCRCAEDFRGYVLKNYRISFESGSIR